MICLPTRQTFCCAYIRQLLEMPSNTSKLFVVNFYPKNLGRTCCWSSLHFCTFDSQQGKAKKLRIKFSLRSEYNTGSKPISQVRSYATRKLRSIMQALESREVQFFAAASSSAILLKNCCLLFISRFQQILVSICVFMHLVHLELILVQFC